MMDQEPDTGTPWLHWHYGTKAEAEQYAENLRYSAAMAGAAEPRLTVELDREGGWNVWLWE